MVEMLWLGGSKVAIPAPQLIDGFNLAETHLGTDWVERHRVDNGVVRTGALATLPVATTGIKLRSVKDAVGLAGLVARLRASDRAAFSELSAAYLCVRGLSSMQLEVGMPVPVGARTRRPDFRVASGTEPWTHVEVTAPSHPRRLNELRC